MSRKILPLLMALWGAACATLRPAEELPNEYVTEDGTKVVCDMEASTGSNFRERVCRRVSDKTEVEDRRAVDSIMSKPTMQNRPSN